MQTLQFIPLIESAVSEVLEGMCFISFEGESTAAGSCQPDWIYGELDFTGPLNGSFAIAVLPSTAAIMAANFLGEDELALDDEQISDVVGEFTNMICGSLLAHLDPQNDFTLSPPRSGRDDQQNALSEVHNHNMFQFDEGLIATWLHIRDGA